MIDMLAQIPAQGIGHQSHRHRHMGDGCLQTVVAYAYAVIDDRIQWITDIRVVPLE